MAYIPLRSRYKIYIIDEAHQLTREAFNALLKTLEEPPPHVKFIFATTEPNKLPDTILSRCQRFNFRRISTSQIYEQILKIAKQEKLSYEPAVLTAIARFARGSMRDAQSLLDQVLSYAKDKVTMQDLENLSGTINPDTIFEIADAIAQKQLERLVKTVDDIFVTGKDINNLLEQMVEHFWYLALSLIDPKDTILKEQVIGDTARYRKQASAFNIDTLLKNINLITETKKGIKETSATRLWVELLMIKLAQVEQNGTVTPVQARTPTREPVKANNPVIRESKNSAPEPVAKPAPPTNPEPPDNQENHLAQGGDISLMNDDDKTKLWSRILLEVKNVSPYKIYPFLKEGKFIRADQHEISIGFTKQYNFHRTRMEEIQNKKIVEECIEKVTGQKIPLSLTVIASPGQDDAGFNGANGFANTADAVDPMKKEVMKDELVRKIVEAFDGRIIEVKDAPR
ncbi:MAG: DNA polymerase III subunit gamma/tau [Planctomycetes bacterium]|nr:DNA polymerase III subunit gamma/tau [Planctomycetota bacterium]